MPMPNISIKVTQKDIDQALRKDSARCVVATAVAAAIPDATSISVDVQSVKFTSGGKRHTYLTPPAVAGYVVAFDAGDKIFPFRFILREDQHIETARRRHTEAGNAKNTAAVNEKAARKKRDRAEAKLEAALASEAEPLTIAGARGELAAAEAAAKLREMERAEVMAAYAGEPVAEMIDAELPPPIPQVFKRNSRHYGMRRLRINQPSVHRV